ncbi:hypothetical protein A2U01_0041693 [Trifolium medium]|uniref:Uncharacterized protein n=1 Tax=Trifolium medium TaxID=97028 RepID=A0A392Q889_9FABA|nr:hypothetical protein [Trifolium medium]
MARPTNASGSVSDDMSGGLAGSPKRCPRTPPSTKGASSQPFDNPSDSSACELPPSKEEEHLQQGERPTTIQK